MDAYREALSIASAALSTHPRYGLRIPGQATAIGDIAAHLVATAALRRRRVSPSASVPRHVEAGMHAVSRLSLLTDDPDPEAGEPTRTGVNGKVGADWSYGSGFIHHYRDAWQLSGVLPGVFPVLPRMLPDLEEMQRRFRDELRSAGLPDGEMHRATVRAGSNPHGTGDDRPWTEFHFGMDDDRLSLSNWIVDLGHKAEFAAQDSIRSYARQAVEVHLNAMSLQRMADVVECLCIEAGDEAPTLRFGKVSIHSVSLARGGPLKDSVVMHASMTGLSEALTEIPLRAVFTGRLGMTTPQTTGLPAMAEVQEARHRAFARHGGAMVDATGLDLLRAAGHDVERMLEDLQTLGATDKRVSGERGSKAWLSASSGRVTASVDIAPEARWKHDRIEIRRTFPESVLSSLPGRSAHDVLDHPALVDAVVASASTANGRTVVRIVPRWLPLP